MYVFCIDAARNLSPIGSFVVSDVIAPDKAVVNAVSNKDKVVTGRAEVGSTITVSSSKVLGTATTGVNGKFSVAIPAQNAGTVLTVVVSDPSLNKSKTTVTVLDKIAPKVTGVANNGLYNKNVTIYFNEGKAALNGKAVATKTVVKTDGSYTLVVTDASGNKTTVKFAIDKKAPSTPTVDKITVKSTKVTGKAEAYSTVVVKVSGKVIGSRTADKYGKFSITIAKQKAGKVVEVVAIDKAGNVSKTAKVTVK